MRWVVVALVLVLAGQARAQSGLSQEDWAALQKGEISESAHIAGGAVGTMFGFGLGHAVQGRMDQGWKFLVGEGVSFGFLLYGFARCVDTWSYDEGPYGNEGSSHCPEWALVGGAIGLLVFRVWELVDVWGGPVWHNERVKRARARAFTPYVGPVPSGHGLGGVTAGFSVRF